MTSSIHQWHHCKGGLWRYPWAGRVVKYTSDGLKGECSIWPIRFQKNENLISDLFHLNFRNQIFQIPNFMGEIRFWSIWPLKPENGVLACFCFQLFSLVLSWKMIFWSPFQLSAQLKVKGRVRWVNIWAIEKLINHFYKFEEKAAVLINFQFF